MVKEETEKGYIFDFKFQKFFLETFIVVFVEIYIFSIKKSLVHILFVKLVVSY